MKKVDEDAVIKALKDNGNNKSRVAELLGIDRNKVRRIASKHQTTRNTETKTPVKTTGTVPMGVLMSKYNPITKILELIAAIPNGEFMRDSDLALGAEVSQSKWTRLRNHDQLKKHKLRTPDGCIYWGSVRDVNSARAELLKG
jgi:hypothetical protein